MAQDCSFVKTLGKVTKLPAFLGMLIGFMAALVQALIGFGPGSAGGPPAYGFCVACHTRDLIDTLFNAFFGTALVAVLPVLTILGVYLGGRGSAVQQQEYKRKTSKPHVYVVYLLGGIAVMILALFLGGCPYRAALRFGYGDLIAGLGILGIVGGVLAGVGVLTWYIKNPIFRRGK